MRLVEAAMMAARAAQPAWADTPVSARLAILRRTRKSLARGARDLAATAFRPDMEEAQLLLAEVMPLLAAIRFIECHAPSLLAPRRPPGTRPAWLWGTQLRVRRIPLGVVLIVAPGNYPLLLAGVQALQALAAGNAVAVKPAPGRAAPMRALAEALRQAGLPPRLFAVLPDSREAAQAALAAGPDKLVLTGAEDTGRAVLQSLAPRLIPAVLELSGDDALIVLPDADIAALASAVAGALALNGGRTCIAPRRILAVGPTADALAAALPPGLAITRIESEAEIPPPTFGPVACLLRVRDAAAAVRLANAARHQLGAAVWGPAAEARALAARLKAGCVVVNDLIVPTADPRLPFGGAGASGYGTTRGAEGLLEMTRPQAIIARSRPSALLWRPVPPRALPWIARLLRLLYG